MTNRDLLIEIHRENKAINRNLQRLISIGQMGILAKMEIAAREKDDANASRLAKIGIRLIAVCQILLIISEIMDLRKAKTEGEDKEEESQETDAFA